MDTPLNMATGGYMCLSSRTASPEELVRGHHQIYGHPSFVAGMGRGVGERTTQAPPLPEAVGSGRRGQAVGTPLEKRRQNSSGQPP